MVRLNATGSDITLLVGGVFIEDQDAIIRFNAAPNLVADEICGGKGLTITIGIIAVRKSICCGRVTVVVLGEHGIDDTKIDDGAIGYGVTVAVGDQHRPPPFVEAGAGDDADCIFAG